jgi:hypothetical protein
MGDRIMVNRLFLGIVVGSCIVGSVQAADQLRPPVPAAEIAQIKADVTAKAYEYMARFSRQDPNGLASQVFSNPSIAVRNGKIELREPAALASGFASTVKKLKETGWVRSAFINPKVCVLTTDVALMDTRYERYDKDNKLILEGGETDLFIRTPEGWRLAAVLGHRSEYGVNCKQ